MKAESTAINLDINKENPDQTDGVTDLKIDAMEVDDEGVGLKKDVADMGINDAAKDEARVKTKDVVCVMKFETPVQDVSGSPPFPEFVPSWELMSQPLDDENNGNGNLDIHLMYESPSKLHVIDLHTSINKMKRQEFEFLKKLAEHEDEIRSLKKKRWIRIPVLSLSSQLSKQNDW